MSVNLLTTPRLLLRPWRESDLPLFATINADPKVMEFYTHPLSRQESDALALKLQHERYGCWALEVKKSAAFIGYISLTHWDLGTSFSPCIDIGWRLDSSHWGQGYATEGGTAVLHYAFHTLHIPEVVSMATLHNIRSQRVMQRLGMHTDPQENFAHPKLPKGHPLSERVLYRLKARFDKNILLY